MLREREFVKNFAEHFWDIEDHRQESKIAYPLIELVFLAIVAVAARAESWEEIEEFGKAHIDTLREYFPFENGTPSDCTIRRFFTSLDSIVKPIELGDTNFVSYLRKQVSRFPPSRE